MIDLTPLEVRKKKGDFRRAMRGYDPALVDDFLDLVADRLEQLVRDHMALTERVGQQEQQNAEYRERERALTEALVTAQEMREEIRKQSAREAELARRTAEQDVAQLRAAVQQEAAQLRAAVQQEAAEQRATVLREKEREEEAIRHLRARQEQFLNSYRAFLERELSELGVFRNAVGVGAAQSAAATTAAAAVPAAPARAPVAAAPVRAAAVPPPAPAAPAPAAQGTRTGFDTTPTLTLTPSPSGEFPPATGGDTGLVGDLSLALPQSQAAPYEPFEPEPFEPEPFEPEAIEETALAAEDDPDDIALMRAPLPVVETDAAALYDGVAPPEDDGVPGPIGLVTNSELAWGTADGADEDEEDEEDDEETARLLRNAAAAGYDLPDEDELLLDEPVEEGDVKDGTWLPNLLEEES